MTDDETRGPGDLPACDDVEEQLSSHLRESYNPPPEPPLNAMWWKIEQDRIKARDERKAKDDARQGKDERELKRARQDKEDDVADVPRGPGQRRLGRNRRT